MEIADHSFRKSYVYLVFVVEFVSFSSIFQFHRNNDKVMVSIKNEIYSQIGENFVHGN